MHANHATTKAMEPFPHEIFKREMEMRQSSESDEHLEELHISQEEVEKRLSVEESAVKYKRELWQHGNRDSDNYYYEYYNNEGDVDGENAFVVEFSLRDAESSTGRMSPEQVVDISSNIGKAYLPPPRATFSLLPPTPTPPPPHRHHISPYSI
ncbi:hypothetical protein ZWY2020_036921 [Hordeum vulgare]|nr:hypothetical protein ZWY2020_036921 [Hordeum vulgare]